MSDLLKIIGENIRNIRTGKGLGRKDIAGLLAISETEVAALEDGTADVGAGVLYLAASVLGVRLEAIICSHKSRDQLLKRITDTLRTCTEGELLLIFEYMTAILKK